MDFCGFYDYVQEVSRLSCTLQISSLLPWHADKAIELSLTNLLEMSTALRTSPPDSSELRKIKRRDEQSETLFPQLIEALDQLKLENPEYRGRPVIHKQQAPIGQHTRALSQIERYNDVTPNQLMISSMERSASYIDTFRNPLQLRRSFNNQEILLLSKSLFCLEEIFNRDDDFIPEQELGRSLELAIAANHFNETITVENLKHQYLLFSRFAHQTCKPEYVESQSFKAERDIEINFYSTIFTCENNFNDIAHLVASSFVRVSNECVIESMGSVINRLTNYRTPDPDTIDRETFIAWNGPDISQNCIPFIQRSISHRFGSSNPEDWNVTHTDLRHRSQYEVQSKVVQRMNNLKGRIQFNSNEEADEDNLLLITLNNSDKPLRICKSVL